MTPSGYSGNLPTQYAAVDTGPRLTCISIKEPIKTSDNRPKILIVDDDRLNQKLVKALVELEGFYAIVAGSAVEGLSLAETERPDLILMDIQLPDMSGLEATKRIKSSDHLKTTPIVALSAYAMKHDIEAALEAGCVSYVTKPFESASLMATLRSHLPPNTDE